MIQSLSLGYALEPEQLARNGSLRCLVEKESEWKIKKFAGPLKQVASILLGVPVERFEDREFKKSCLGKEWGNMTVREFLQNLGTNAIRDGLHRNSWINAMWANYSGEKILVTDCRFTNEAESVRERGGIVVRLTRNGDEPATHVSETELDNYIFDYTIDNKNDTLSETFEKVKDFMSYFGIGTTVERVLETKK